MKPPQESMSFPQLLSTPSTTMTSSTEVASYAAASATTTTTAAAADVDDVDYKQLIVALQLIARVG